MAESTSLRRATATARRGAAARRARRRTLLGLAFASPWIVGALVFTLGPIAASAYYSFTDFNIFQPPTWVGLENYTALFGDDRFRTALWNTAYLTVLGVPLGLLLGLLTAMALNFPVRGQPIYRAVLYLPAIVPVVTATYVWRWLLNAQYGMINRLLELLHLPQPDWIGDPAWTKPAVLLISFWGIGTTTIIYLAALKEVPAHLYEAAEVDGANAWQRFRHVTWPLITPVTLFQLIVGIINSLQVFTQPYLLAQQRLNQASGGPENSLLTYSLYLFQNAFVHLKMGYAAAMAWILFLITVVLTALVLATSKRWVHYGSR
ncbi:carbohydrate ABC transporter permease [Thermasporomyces composti]|jgi:multiple sugar transport system permease protein|uniref:Carbohydrate ABC transporter membrane protein 1 (CUT1 family) n=1 Tax=Thermasporomyces composti TaxID=696763 RepID=A0A3D9V9Y1_THECX|nr:sugar ABC transporter permease [Thermasporomyces composti]REF35805.1 carbohydrate ABC transporter membrane protein 1 (CUT1 family) [Thermasporomyces composti]